MRGFAERGVGGRVQGAADAAAAAVEDMGVDHGGADVAVTQELLNRADVVAVFQEMRREGVSQGVAAGGFGDSGSLKRLLEGAL